MYDGYWTNYKELILGTPMSIRSKSQDRIITVPGDAMSVRSKSEEVRRVAASRWPSWWMVVRNEVVRRDHHHRKHMGWIAARRSFQDHCRQNIQ